MLLRIVEYIIVIVYLSANLKYYIKIQNVSLKLDRYTSNVFCHPVAYSFTEVERSQDARRATALSETTLRLQSPRLLYIGTRKLWPKQRRSARGSVNTKHSLAYRLKRNLYSVRLPRLRRKTKADAEKRRRQSEPGLTPRRRGGRKGTSGVAGGRVGSTAQRARGPPLIDLCSSFSGPL